MVKERGKGQYRYLCYKCDKIFRSNLTHKQATCPYCKAVPCVSCGKMPRQLANRGQV